MEVIKLDDSLNHLQKLAIGHLASGKSASETARELNITRQNLYKMSSNKEFKRELNTMLGAQISMLMVEGFDQLRDILLYAPSPKDKLQAYAILGKLAEMYNNNVLTLTTTHKMTLDDVLKDII